MKRYILAHDLGTTGNKATLFDAEGTMLASAFSGYETFHPYGHWAEQEPEDWWRAVIETTQKLLADARVAPQDVAVIGFSGQMMGCLPVDAHGRPLRRCIIWADQRAVEQADRLAAALGEEQVYRITGHRISPTYSGAKIMWVRDHEPDVFAQAYKFLHVKDFVAMRMTGAFVTDRSDASGMNLYHLEEGRWSHTILEAVQLDEGLLPEVHDSTDVVGELTAAAAEALGLVPGIPVVIGGGDGASAAVGAGAIEEGPAYNYIGASSWISFASRRPIYDAGRRIFNWAHMVPGMFLPCGTMQAAGGSYQWLRRQVCWYEAKEAEQKRMDVYEVMNQRAEQSPPGAHGLIFLPYLQGERSPHWNPKARGGFIGLQITHTRADMIRAVLEGISMNLRTILLSFLEAGARIDEVTVIGGGAKGKLWRQILADVYGRPVLRPRLLEEATSLGAAVAAGVGVGLFRDFNVVHELLEIVDRHTPSPDAQAVYEHLYPVFLAAYDALVPVFDRLHTLSIRNA
ncbi:MAG: xylulokinase [Ardenticatenia bacterium]|jgi:xylulokinase|nr:MAG: xylulokinase [Ardenticatenia bacterium]